MEKQRLNNIEVLRIISMIMVITLHFLKYTGLLNNNGLSINSFIIWFVESLCFVAVNCYVLISGYFLCDSKFKISKIFKIWCVTEFYSLLMFLTFLLAGKTDFTMNNILHAIFPVSTCTYWFVSTYVLLYILSPYINILIKRLDKIRYQALLIIVLVFFSIIPTILPTIDTINYGGSYSISWFICLYLFAGYIKKFPFDKNINRKKYLNLFLIFSFINVFIMFILRFLNINVEISTCLYNYYSVTVLVSSIFLFLYFKNIEIKNVTINKIISIISCLTFGVYLIHENPNIRNFIWSIFQGNSYNNTFDILIRIVFIPILLFIMLGIIEFVRQKIMPFEPNLIRFGKLKKIEDVINNES